MKEKDLEQWQYPIGRFQLTADPQSEQVAEAIAVIAEFPDALRVLVNSMDSEQLDSPYRPGGWTVRQLVHHLADSHTNAYIRFKWGLTESKPQIKTYLEKEWANLPEASSGPVALSLELLSALHARWSVALKSMDQEQWQREIFHPGFGDYITLSQLVLQYGWHCSHHLAHIARARNQD